MVPLNAGERFPFSLDQDIIAPIQILQELGIDLFDAKYESWVLFNVWYVFLSFKIDQSTKKCIGIVSMPTGRQILIQSRRIRCTPSSTTLATPMPLRL